MLRNALRAEDGINEKAAVGEVHDEPELQSEDEDKEVEFVEVQGMGKGKMKEKGKDVEETVLTKAFKIEAPLCSQPQKNQATNLLTQISAQLDPAAQQWRDEKQATHSFQLVYLQGLQAQLNEERRHWEQAEAQVHELELSLVHLETTVAIVPIFVPTDAHSTAIVHTVVIEIPLQIIKLIIHIVGALHPSLGGHLVLPIHPDS
ncbi:hypothetical protein GYMLUDRAFT_250395 [Collybiopsis luxurians FD-317 M1]|uniref:Uncharacterized protein n=1 Tax=Collybiopsis luxurians FD-317 M1 TaxID=944289 RepID=A0A0D0CEN4_9AGAR|nr:hypothetical protein GYMLUDRAFT_250395 [Collybiopsis luxurians FD-317 M1]